jgi:hypothetical protein
MLLPASLLTILQAGVQGRLADHAPPRCSITDRWHMNTHPCYSVRVVLLTCCMIKEEAARAPFNLNT